MTKKVHHLLRFPQYLNLVWWLMSFRGYKSMTFMYYEKYCGMQDIFAYRRAKDMTRKEFKSMKVEMEEKIKSHNKKELLKT